MGRRRQREGLGNVVESEAAHCLVLVAVNSARLLFDPATTLMQGWLSGKDALPHDLRSVRVVIQCPNVVICSNSNREIRPDLARPDEVTAPDSRFEMNYRIVPTLQQRGESKYTVPRK